MRFFQSPPPDSVNPRYPCGVCGKHVGVRMRAVKCDLCQYWGHIKCEGIEAAHYEKLKILKIINPIFVKFAKKKCFLFKKSIMNNLRLVYPKI